MVLTNCTQTDIAAFCGFAQSSLSLWVNGKYAGDTRALLAKFQGVGGDDVSGVGSVGVSSHLDVASPESIPSRRSSRRPVIPTCRNMCGRIRRRS